MNVYVKVPRYHTCNYPQVFTTLKEACGEQPAVFSGLADEWICGEFRIFRRRIVCNRVELALIDARNAGIESAQAGIEEFFRE